LEVTGIEPSEKFTDFLRDNEFEIYKSMEEMLEESPEKKFDLIVHFFVMEHIRDTRDFLLKQIRMLND